MALDETKIRQAYGMLAAALGDVTVPVVTPGPWYEPTDEEKKAFALENSVSLADLEGYPGQSADGSWPSNTAQTVIKPCDATDEKAILARLKFGYLSSGVRYTWTKHDLVAARALAYRIEQADDPYQAEKVIPGAGNVTGLVAQVLVFGGGLVSGYFVATTLGSMGLDGSATVVDAMARLASSQSGPPMFGIGGR